MQDGILVLYVQPAEVESAGGAGPAVSLLERAFDFVTDNPVAQAEIRQLLRSQVVKASMKHVSRDAALLGSGGFVWKRSRAKSVYDRYQKCRGY